ncbi:PDZ domain-containing protein [Bradyrhizobium erythrophlei]|uniref:PDZ domain-containing protein n=1 Tax=Bradyrhizobium erythrophlei TaxID=1437360 RepID=UPI0035E48AEB
MMLSHGVSTAFIAVVATLAACLPMSAQQRPDALEADRLLFGPVNGRPGGLYAIEGDYNFNVLDSVYYNPQTNVLSLIGHLDLRYPGPPIPYLQHLSALLTATRPEFSLRWTPASETQVDLLLKRSLSQTEIAKISTQTTNMFDAQGRVNAIGVRTLTNFRLSPVIGGKRPAYLGADTVQGPNGSVIVSAVQKDSPAAIAGLITGDIVTHFAGRVPLDPGELARSVRFAGAGSKVVLTVTRNGASQKITTTLDPDIDQSAWRDATRYDAQAAFFRAAGETTMAATAYDLGVFNTLKDDPVAFLALGRIFESLGIQAVFTAFQQKTRQGAIAPADSIDFARKLFARIDEVFRFSGSPTLTAFNSAISRGVDAGSAVSVGFAAFDKVYPRKFGEYLDRIMLRPEGVQIPAEVIESVVRIHPEMAPEFIGIGPDTLLARAMFAGDYVIKQMANRPDLKSFIPEYQTKLEYDQTHPASKKTESTYRIWISVAKVDQAPSADGLSLNIRDARLQFNMREQQNHRDLPPSPGGYESKLNAIIDQLERYYPVLHELREAAKLSSAANWIRSKTPGFRLPSEGMVRWSAPSRVPGLVFEYLTSPDPSYLKAKIHWIAEGGVSLVVPPDQSRPGADPSIAPDSLIVDPKFYQSGLPERYKLIIKEVPLPDAFVAQSRKGRQAIEAVTLMLGRASSKDPGCIAARRTLTDAASVARQLDQTERAIKVLSQDSRTRTIDLEQLQSDLTKDRDEFRRRITAWIFSARSEALGQLEKGHGFFGRESPDVSDGTKSFLRLLNHEAEATEVAGFGPDDEEKPTVRKAVFEAAMKGFKELAKDAPDPMTAEAPSVPSLAKPLLGAYSDAKFLTSALLQEAAFAKLEFVDDFKVGQLQSGQAAELNSLKGQLQPLQRRLSDHLDVLMKSVHQQAANCRPR